ncbi:MAG: PilN domain-containing protein [Deltaproteobacteria bacterium]|nr:PilN domain-containing protein [Deltaproteobacteria bacterium]
MIRINLLSAARKQTKSSSGPSTGSPTAWFIGYAVAAGVLGVALLFVYMSYTSERDAQIAQNQQLETEIVAVERQSANLDQVQAQLEQSRALETVVNDLQRARFGPTRVMMELARILSASGGPTIDPRRLEEIQRANPLAGYNAGWDHHRLWLTSFQEEARHVQIHGAGRTNEDVAEFLRRLTLSDLFAQVTLTKTEAAEDEATHLDVINFELAATVNY